MWDSPQTARYAKLIEISNLDNSTVLEIGAGLGGFYDYLVNHANVKNIVYEGIDIVPELIKTAKLKWPDVNFYYCNLFKQDLSKIYDYIFFCGVFNNYLVNGDEYMKALITKAFHSCKKGMAFNFISSYVNYREDKMGYHSPITILQYCIENLSKKVYLQHHYMKCDTVVYVYK